MATHTLQMCTTKAKERTLHRAGGKAKKRNGEKVFSAIEKNAIYNKFYFDQPTSEQVHHQCVLPSIRPQFFNSQNSNS